MPGSPEKRLELFNALGRAAGDLWRAARQLEGLNTDPKMVSVTLYQRLSNNHRAFGLLWLESLSMEADMVLRSAAETAICLAALKSSGNDFVDLLRSDAAVTMLSQVNLLRVAGDTELADRGEKEFHRLFGQRRPNGQRHRKLDWQELANTAGVSWLYAEHRSLSGTASHVTGLSLILDITYTDEPGSGRNRRKDKMTMQELRLHKMCMVLALGSRDHAAITCDPDAVDQWQDLMRQLDLLGLPIPDDA